MVTNLVSGMTQTIGVGGDLVMVKIRSLETAILSPNLSFFGVDFL